MHDPLTMQKFVGKLMIRDRGNNQILTVQGESLDKFHFFFRVPLTEIPPFVEGAFQRDRQQPPELDVHEHGLAKRG